MERRAGGLDQVVEHLPSNCEALSLNTSITPPKNAKNEEREKDQEHTLT
jgi:hypothetical protein